MKKDKRTIKPRCNCRLSSLLCNKEKALQCYKLSEQDRNVIFHKFWKEMDWNQRKTFVNLSVENSRPKRHRNRSVENESRRQFSSKYYLQKGIDKIRVCKQMFLNTICMGERMVNIWKYAENGPVQQVEDEDVAGNIGTVGRRDRYKEMKSKLQEFFEQLPKVESHYCRSKSSKLYLEPTWTSKSELYNVYKNVWCKEKGINYFSVATFSHIFAEMNLSIFRPKKDECDKCVSYKTGNLPEELHVLHQEKKKEAREAKERDKNSADMVFCMDLQSVLLSPKSNVSSLYFKTKLIVHNYTIFNMKTKDGFCFIWHEAAGGVTANEYASILSFFIENYVLDTLKNDQKIIFWSDGCTSQNRNSTISNALINVAMKHKLEIEQKYLEKGHTQMEADSMHSTIERKLRNKSINVPADYVGVCLQARKIPQPYHVKYLDYSFFKNFSQLQFLRSLRPGRRVGDPVVTDIRALKYTSDGSVAYKLRHTENYTAMEYRNKKNINECFNYGELPQLYERPLPIKKSKYDHLQSLKASLEKDYHEFYNNLPFKN